MTTKLFWMRAAIIASLLWLVPGQLVAAAWQVGSECFANGGTLVNFDITPGGLPIADGEHLTDIYSEWGITFADDVIATSTAGIATSLPNRCSGPMGLYPIRCYFMPHVHAVGAYGFDFVLRVYDANGSLIYAVSYTDGTEGLYGGREDELAFLGIASDEPIAEAVFSRYWSDQWIYGFQIDDLHFLTEPQVGMSTTSWSEIKAMYR